tara:strand:- start:3827 stop:4021 length:195 start_codon:yes stop_codon:yes gene_type:complete
MGNGMPMMSIQDGTCMLVHDERFGVSTPTLGHFEELIPVSWFDFFMSLQPLERHEFDIVISPRH